MKTLIATSLILIGLGLLLSGCALTATLILAPIGLPLIFISIVPIGFAHLV